MAGSNDSAEKTDWTKVRKTCRKCGKEKLVVPDFGLMTLGGQPSYPQSMCNVCRIAIVTSHL
ncbi:hypothetical protein QEG98_28395 [Myxococcus sp. MxC21-1]|uniref:hypothetical protein n=1 Tax=Myxococcus sp. MxC21-1 TaxID=3041439 RepID=UPI00292FFAF4|nr:hypothetical protein [Myxococcus sp. MxC21-1]WNZ59927.1 hypothetical protein QEG98_28395 [Myxococcus sp. MxC21-1]